MQNVSLSLADFACVLVRDIVRQSRLQVHRSSFRFTCSGVRGAGAGVHKSYNISSARKLSASRIAIRKRYLSFTLIQNTHYARTCFLRCLLLSAPCSAIATINHQPLLKHCGHYLHFSDRFHVRQSPLNNKYFASDRHHGFHVVL